MKCFTQEEIDHWLTEQQVTPSPYGKSESPNHYLQFKMPGRALANSAFIRNFLMQSQSKILVDVTDWPTYEPAEMLIIDSLRHKCGESRNLIDAPGHLFSAEESEWVIALFGHIGSFEWNGYLYRPNDLATLYCWEGELYDFWSADADTHLALTRLTNRFGLELTAQG